MFGYYRPFRIGLDKELERVFECYYCRICYCLWNVGNQRARALTTFDAALYSIILNLAGIGERPRHLNCQRVATSNKKLLKGDYVGEKLANLTLVGFGGKMEDDYADKQFFKATIMKILYGRAIKKAYNNEPVFLKNTREVCQQINEIQDALGEAEEALDAYGKSSVKSFLEIGPMDEKYQNMIYQLAKWSFFMDMICDYNEDFKDGANNSYKNEKYPTLQKYLEDNWQFIIPLMRKYNTDLFNAVMAIKEKKDEWYLLRDVVVDAINKISVGVLYGEDVSFHYFKELFANIKKFNKQKKIHRKVRRLQHANN